MSPSPAPRRRGRPLKAERSTDRLTPGMTHGRISTYTSGCSCNACREAWRAWSYERNRAYAQRKRRERVASHPAGCMCRTCVALREAGEL